MAGVFYVSRESTVLMRASAYSLGLRPLITGPLSAAPRIIAAVITQDWNKMDGHFDYEENFWTIHDLYDDKDFDASIIRHWHKVVFDNSKPRATAPTAAAGPTTSTGSRLPLPLLLSRLPRTPA
ncbi:hypothetical protein K438DRAFT_1931323 [Mycena galopus ATCC 62051]|nr:hypothetical protein K438DRAFT_1931323 [Mycena galopus ATCC 62051]